MSSQDRSYYRDSQDHHASSLARLVTGSVPMFSTGGFQVRIHAVALLAAMIYLAGGAAGADMPPRLLTIAVLLGLVLIHEAGHIFVAGIFGGRTGEILLWPLGGLADARPPHRKLPVLLTAAAGPLTNLGVCSACWLALHILPHSEAVMLQPFALVLPQVAWSDPRFYFLLIFDLSYVMLLFNLLPVLPLDAGRILQCTLWPFMGYGRALLSACNIGILLAAAIALSAMAVGQWLLFFVMLSCLLISVQRRSVVNAAGIGSDDDPSGELRPSRHHHLTRLAKWRARRQIRQEEAETIRVDEILTKVHHTGIRSLSWGERRLLRRATIRQRECVMEEASHQS